MMGTTKSMLEADKVRKRHIRVDVQDQKGRAPQVRDRRQCARNMVIKSTVTTPQMLVAAHGKLVTI